LQASSGALLPQWHGAAASLSQLGLAIAQGRASAQQQLTPWMAPRKIPAGAPLPSSPLLVLPYAAAAGSSSSLCCPRHAASRAPLLPPSSRQQAPAMAGSTPSMDAPCFSLRPDLPIQHAPFSSMKKNKQQEAPSPQLQW
jgi:hypothetical protein